MPMIDFYFNGVVRGATIEEAFDREGNKIDVRRMSVYELAIALGNGDLTIELAPYLSEHITCEINMDNFTASRFRPREGDNG